MVYGINEFIHLTIPTCAPGQVLNQAVILYLKKASSAGRCKKFNILCLPNAVHKEMYCT